MGTATTFGPPDAATIHLCIDMQRLFSAGGVWATPWIKRVLPIVAALTQHAPERTAFTRFIPPRDPDDMPGAWQPYYRKWRNVTLNVLDPAQIELLPELGRYAPPAATFDKPTYSAFGSPELVPFLRGKGVTGLIITGAETDACVLATVMAAVDHGYRVYLVTDAVCSSSDEGHDSLVGLYTRRFAEQIQTVTARQVLETWRP